MDPYKISLLSLVLVSIASVGCGQRATPTKGKAAPLIAAGVSGVAEVRARSQEWSALATNQPVLEGSVVRTGADSVVAMDSQVSADRIVLGKDSEVGVEQWKVMAGSRPSAERVRLDVRRGVVVMDVPILSGASIFEVKGSNFVASARSGAAVAAITADGFVLVRAGTVACVFITPNFKAVSVILTAGQMVDPGSMAVKAIPVESNLVWNLLGP